jgi:hypothetical protein
MCGRCNVEDGDSRPRNLAAYWPDEDFPSKLRANGARRWGSNPHSGPQTVTKEAGVIVWSLTVLQYCFFVLRFYRLAAKGFREGEEGDGCG